MGQGSFGSIYKGVNIRTYEEVAIKMESIQDETKLLKHEAQVYQYLGSVTGFPIVKWYGIYKNNYYMVLNMLGPSLSQIKEVMITYSLDMTLMIGKQIIERLEYIHEKSLIHRDIKPDNFIMGKKETQNIVHLIDFGFCKRYISDNMIHMNIQTGLPLIGTPNYVSINVHDGISASRRDDIESVGYVLIYLLNKDWTNITREKKMSMRTDLSIPPQIRECLFYCDQLKFDEQPDYKYLIDLFSNK